MKALALLLALAACGDARRGHDGGAGDDDLGVDDAGLGDLGSFPDDFGAGLTHDPATCAEAARRRSYVGCDYWPTVTANVVWNVFDFAVVVSNPGVLPAYADITGGALGARTRRVLVPPQQLVRVGLPWVDALKGDQADPQGGAPPLTHSVLAKKGAYHLVSDRPVVVYQFNALEYRASTNGANLVGKPWTDCPAVPCFSYSNDASLLLPSTAMTPNYIVTGIPGDDEIDMTTPTPVATPVTGSYAVITATRDRTLIKIALSPSADILASADGVSVKGVIKSVLAPGKTAFRLDAGDVVELVTSAGAGFDLTGSVVQASAPIQLLVGNPCTTNPTEIVVGGVGRYTCDHVEETVMPYETWGRTYVVSAPTGPNGVLVTQTVRLYGGAHDATLTFTPTPPGAPATLAARSVVTLEHAGDFVVSGTQPFAVGSEQKSAEIVDARSMSPRGDPALSSVVAVEQFRDRYVVLAPDDYDLNFADVVVQHGTYLTLDAVPVTLTPVGIGGGYDVLRLPLRSSAHGAHVLVGTQPFGLQVLGYGAQTSYQYPGGLDLKVLGRPPPPIP